MTCIVPVSGGLKAYVDDEDATLVRQYVWNKLVCPNTTYASALIDGDTVFLHRLVLDYYGADDVDHRNSDGLDCRKSNLRILDRGVHHLNRRNTLCIEELERQTGTKYRARINFEGVPCHLGTFKSFDVATRVVSLNKRRVFAGLRPVAYKAEYRGEKPKWINI